MIMNSFHARNQDFSIVMIAPPVCLLVAIRRLLFQPGVAESDQRFYTPDYRPARRPALMPW
jgi:hypothetical protein